jgi:GH15 family glucan-1,4-alpha-glucosidase
MIGETDRAHAFCHKLLSCGSKLLLYAEQIGTAISKHLGNFPQAFTQLALTEVVSLRNSAEPADDRTL